MSNKNIKKIVLASSIIAINVASRGILQFLPNVKPVTALIILTTVYFGLDVGTFVVIGTVLISGLLFGFGTFMPFQFVAWELIAILAYVLRHILKNNKVVFLIFALVSGFFFGIVVSLDTFFLYGFSAYLAYYLNGLIFDVMHAVGNVVFSGILYIIYIKLDKQKVLDDFKNGG